MRYSFFYKNKLKTPLQELKDASQMIADNELDFHVSYEIKMRWELCVKNLK